jgi:hypothetical protein
LYSYVTCGAVPTMSKWRKIIKHWNLRENRFQSIWYAPAEIFRFFLTWKITSDAKSSARLLLYRELCVTSKHAPYYTMNYIPFFTITWKSTFYINFVFKTHVALLSSYILYFLSAAQYFCLCIVYFEIAVEKGAISRIEITNIINDSGLLLYPFLHNCLCYKI